MAKETSETLEAFEYYYSLGDKRSKQVVANKFERSLQTIRNWEKEFSWEDKIIKRDVENAKKASEASNITVVEVNKLMWAMIFKLGKMCYMEMGNNSIETNCRNINAITDVITKLSTVGFNAGTEGNNEIIQSNSDTRKLANSMRELMDKYDGGDTNE